MEPKRIQRKRTKGWKMPENTISVTRPGKWGNPFKVSDLIHEHVRELKKWGFAGVTLQMMAENGARDESIEKFKEYLESNPELIEKAKIELKGKNLACFCSLQMPCHADVLLELANKP